MSEHWAPEEPRSVVLDRSTLDGKREIKFYGVLHIQRSWISNSFVGTMEPSKGGALKCADGGRCVSDNRKRIANCSVLTAASPLWPLPNQSTLQVMKMYPSSCVAWPAGNGTGNLRVFLKNPTPTDPCQ